MFSFRKVLLKMPSPSLLMITGRNCHQICLQPSILAQTEKVKLKEWISTSGTSTDEKSYGYVKRRSIPQFSNKRRTFLTKRRLCRFRWTKEIVFYFPFCHNLPTVKRITSAFT